MTGTYRAMHSLGLEPQLSLAIHLSLAVGDMGWMGAEADSHQKDVPPGG